MDALDDIRKRTLAAIDAATDPAALDAVRVATLGKKGDVTKAYTYKIASYAAKLKMFEVKAYLKGGAGKRASFTFAGSRAGGDPE